MESFDNKVAVITGAANGIGEALARECVKRRIKTVIADINVQKLTQLETELKKIFPDVLAVVADVSDQSDIQKLAEATIDRFGKVNLLFNNAGIAGPLGAIWEVDVNKVHQVIHVNLMSVIYSLHTFIPLMLAQQDECYIVNTASGAGLHTGPNMSGYMASKHAVVALSEVLYFDLKQHSTNIHVSVLCPGLVSTNLVESISVEKTANQNAQAMAEFFKANMQKGISPASVAEETFDAIEKNLFYILTHYDQHKEMIRERMENILERRNPKV